MEDIRDIERSKSLPKNPLVLVQGINLEFLQFLRNFMVVLVPLYDVAVVIALYLSSKFSTSRK